MMIAVGIWIATIITAMVLGTFLCWKIEKSKVERWGAKGKLFKF